MTVDRVIVSADEHTYFKEYINIVVKAWKKFFPKIKISIAFVSNKTYVDKAFKCLGEDVEVIYFPIVDGIPIGNQAKMARHYLACEYDEEVVTIEDIDTIPLQRDYFEDKFAKRKTKTVLLVGKEVYNQTADEGKCPISTMTSESSTFRNLINPNKDSYRDFIKSFEGVKKFDSKEDILKSNFSDESLIRFLLHKNKTATTRVNRNVDIRNDWIDRSWWSINISKLLGYKYITCNFLRPLSMNYGNSLAVVDFIYKTKNTDREKVIFKLRGEE